MKKIILIIISLIFFIPKVFAVTLSEAITQAYKELRDVEALRVFGKKYDELYKEKSKKIKEKYPLKLTETLKKS